MTYTPDGAIAGAVADVAQYSPSGSPTPLPSQCVYIAWTGARHQRIASQEHDPARLLFLALDRHKPHCGPLCCLADSFGIGRIVLLAFDERLDVGRWDQPYRMPKLPELKRLVMRPGARFQSNNAQ